MLLINVLNRTFRHTFVIITNYVLVLVLYSIGAYRGSYIFYLIYYVLEIIIQNIFNFLVYLKKYK